MIDQKKFGLLPDGRKAGLYTLKSESGIEAKICDFGGALVSLAVPDRNGAPRDVVLGFKDLAGYLDNGVYFGVLVGRYANRIKNGSFTLDGKRYQLECNEGVNHLHGGSGGFHKRLWLAEPLSDSALRLSLSSPDGDAGYPGAVQVAVVYRLAQNELQIEYTVKACDRTVCNLTNHSYFNLSGEGNGDILNHVLRIDADQVTTVDSNLSPTGKAISVEGTAFDFRSPDRIGKRMEMGHEQFRYTKGFDQNYILNHSLEGADAEVYSPDTGIRMCVTTERPGMQFYTGNYVASIAGKSLYNQYAGFCLETQLVPDSVNNPYYADTALQKGEKQKYTTTFAFFADDFVENK